jgi:hypothetical protein
VADLTIVCPTHGRAGEVTAFECFGPDLLLCVAESQAPLYREAYPDARLDVHPDSVKGLGPKMTWMAAKYGAFFRIDDDGRQMIDHTDGSRVPPERAVELARRLADTAEAMGAYLFGMTSEVRPLYFNPQTPLRMTGVIDGGKSGFLPGSKLWWPDDVGFADDFWISALNAYHHRFCLIDDRLCIPTQVGQKGGLAAIRTERAIWAKAEVLKAAFGDAVVLKDKADAGFTYPWRLKVPW